ncbi:MAG: class III signal peptide-containing protein [Candidatus ainarchaeum sp.]|nr:class III signal peptide-containing protein [Candidatus ainarchaeum sp.]
MKLSSIIKDDKAQVSLEFLLILGVVVLVALIVGFYLKQTSANQANKVTEYQQKSTQGNN